MSKRSEAELKLIILNLLREWEINDYYVMIDGEGSCIYPDRLVLTVCDEQLTWPEPAVVSSILHEIGHIDRDHCIFEHEDSLLNYLDEYEADEFAFDAVQVKYGYVPPSAGLWILKQYGEELWNLDTLTHPSYKHRWQRLAWNGFVPEDCRPYLQVLSLS